MAPSSDPEIKPLSSAAPSAPAVQSPSVPITEPTMDVKSTEKNANASKAPAVAAQKKDDSQASGPTDKLSGAELKKRAKAEKAARRAKEKLDKEQGMSNGSQSPATPKKGASGGKDGGASGQSQKGDNKNQKHGGSGAAKARRPSMHATAIEQKQKRSDTDDKEVAVFSHLYGQPRRTTIAGAGKDVHPAVLALGLQIRDYVICGSSARCVAMLLTFKRVIGSYTTPLGNSLPRHLMSHLSQQITYLSTCRPLAASQGNAIRALKLAIVAIDPAVPEADAKESLCEFIDSFIREKITVADQVITNSAAQKIKDGDQILTYGHSSIVKQVLLAAHKEGKKFRVSIIDSRPLFEGKQLARALASAGLQVQYSLTHAISHAVKDATKVFLGAHSMTGNGRLYSRVGTALVAMSAKERAGGVDIPVIVCCETVKFTDRVALDSIVVNEIADADELVTFEPQMQFTGLSVPAPVEPATKSKKSANSKDPAEAETQVTAPKSALHDWRERPNLQLVNIMYDTTPTEYIDMVITEMGSLPPSAVPIVHRMSTNQ